MVVTFIPACVKKKKGDIHLWTHFVNMFLGTLGCSSLCEVEHQTVCVAVSQLTSPAAAPLLSVGSDSHSYFTSDCNSHRCHSGCFRTAVSDKTSQGTWRNPGWQTIGFSFIISQPSVQLAKSLCVYKGVIYYISICDSRPQTLAFWKCFEKFFIPFCFPYDGSVT